MRVLWVWLCLGWCAWADPVVRVDLIPPEAGFYVRHSSGAAMPGGPDPRAFLPSGSEFIAGDVNGQRGITLAVRQPGYENFEQTYALAQGKEYWSGSGWVIPIELRPVGVWSYSQIWCMRIIRQRLPGYSSFGLFGRLLAHS